MKYFKLGQIVYHSEYGQGVVSDITCGEEYPIIVEFEYIKIDFTADGRKFVGEKITLSQNPIPEIVNKLIGGEYVSFTFEDNLLGKEVIGKNKLYKGIITYQDESKIVIATFVETYEDLLRDYTFVDGKPCGKLLKN